ncbi:hypothetical protein HZ326_27970 [Fusarium oxysporum f. sp. albedinis]|nr:hypothetical protein HZ326_27970 [Fusarium oxysporum f. sp. albedinis]
MYSTTPRFLALADPALQQGGRPGEAQNDLLQDCHLEAQKGTLGLNMHAIGLLFRCPVVWAKQAFSIVRAVSKVSSWLS